MSVKTPHSTMALPTRALLTGMAIGALVGFWMSSISSQMKDVKAANSSIVVARKVEKEGWVRPSDRIYAHVHIAKTAGTTLNGMMATKYERICGHKGYSYDSFQHNRRREEGNGTTWDFIADYTANLGKKFEKYKYNRGKVSYDFMTEIGYEDCDWISQELRMEHWKTYNATMFPFEYHIPCRDPLDHLMSQCNFQERKFNCNHKNLKKEIFACLVMPVRYKAEVAEQLKAEGAQMKCFDPIPPSRYVEYMDTILQKRRIQGEYIFRATNEVRDKESECVWKLDEDKKQELKDDLLKVWAYYEFCEKCMGTENELPLPL